MSKWKLSLNIPLFAFILLFPLCHCEVTLRVLLQSPMVTLECLIKNLKEQASVLMMCPHDKMCFTNCSRMCDKDCDSNPITCVASSTEDGMKFTYRFSTVNRGNQGEWICHFGSQHSSTVVFVNETDLASPLTSPSIIRTLQKQTSTNMLPSSFSISSRFSPLLTSTKKETPLINIKVVWVLISLFCVSVIINVWLLIRCIQHKRSPKRLAIILSKSQRERPCFYNFCMKLFCVTNNDLEINRNRTKHSYKEMLPRQLSNNIYECGPPSQPAIVLDNYAFVSTPTNSRLLTHQMYARSQSFPSKSIEHKVEDEILPKSLLRNAYLNRPHYSQESIGQIIYDDVADQSMSYMPTYISHGSMLNRPSQYINIGSIQPRLHMTAMSMSNLANTGYRLPEVSATDEDSNDESVLKDAISSRVELSKEMINHADSLLKRADSLLNDKEQHTLTNT